MGRVCDFLVGTDFFVSLFAAAVDDDDDDETGVVRRNFTRSSMESDKGASLELLAYGFDDLVVSRLFNFFLFLTTLP